MSLLTSSLRTDRRTFIKHFALSTAASAWAGMPWTARLLADVGPSGEPLGRIVIKLSDYPALALQFGSVRFRFVGLDGGTFPFALNREDDDTFHAVDTRCTHQGCMVEAFDRVPFAMVCYCHYSEYNLRGEVQAGPAGNALARYHVEYDGVDKVTVFIPGLDMSIRSVTVQERTASSVRLQLVFPTIAYGRYRVLFRQNLEDDPVGVFFASTPTGAATLSEIETDGLPRSVYVDCSFPKGFFSIALIVEEG